MLYRYDDTLEWYGSAYRISRAVSICEVYKVACGVYSDERHPDAVAVVCDLHPQAVLTMDSAFCPHGLTDVVPEPVHVANPRNSTRIRDAGVRQYFILPSLMSTGVRLMESGGYAVRASSRECMLVELLRRRAAHLRWILLRESYAL